MRPFEARRSRRLLPATHLSLLQLSCCWRREAPGTGRRPDNVRGRSRDGRARSDRCPSRTQTALLRPRHYGGGVDGGDPGPGRAFPNRDLAGVAARHIAVAARHDGGQRTFRGTDPGCRQPRGKSVRPRSGGPCPTAATGGSGSGPRAPAGARRRRRDGVAPAGAEIAHDGCRAAPGGPSGSKAKGNGRRFMPISRGRSPLPICARRCAFSTLICVPAVRISTSW